MKIDEYRYLTTVEEAARNAERAERFGYDGWWAPEGKTDAFIACATAAARTERIGVGTGIAVAFARTPMTVAIQANDLQALSGGRFVLGLGSQIRPHITSRYSMQWSRPAARMREFILAVRAIWKAWATGDALDFRGDFYTHTLMTPFFSPGPNRHGNPNIVLAAVGPKMAEVAGEVADGIYFHFFCTERYLREVTLPALRRGAAKAGRDLTDFEITAPGFVVARESQEEIAEGLAFVRQQIGFYGSTPAYRPVLELHGWGGLQDELHALTKRGAWDELASVIDEQVLNTFAIAGRPEDAAAEAQRRYGGLVTRINITVPRGADAARWAPVFDALREPPGS